MNHRSPLSSRLDWDVVPALERVQARLSYDRQMVVQVLETIPARDQLAFVERNAQWLLEDQMYEEFLYLAWARRPPASHCSDPRDFLFRRANAHRLRSLSQPLPGARDSYTLYRVAGMHEGAAEGFGVEWTLSLDAATRTLLADDGGTRSSDDVAIYTAEVAAADILLYLNRRGEARVVIDTQREHAKPRDLRQSMFFRPRVLTRLGSR